LTGHPLHHFIDKRTSDSVSSSITDFHARRSQRWQIGSHSRAFNWRVALITGGGRGIGAAYPEPRRTGRGCDDLWPHARRTRAPLPIHRAPGGNASLTNAKSPTFPRLNPCDKIRRKYRPLTYW